MPKDSPTDATIHAAKYLIPALQNPVPVSSLSTLVNTHKEVLKSLSEIFGKDNTPEASPRVPIEEEYLEKLQQVNQEKNPI